MSAATLPPWGFMEEFVEGQLQTREIPEVWRALGNGDPVEEWAKWRESLIAELATLLWPTYDADEQEWRSPPSEALIDADFELMTPLRGKLDEVVKGLRSETKHVTFFAEEDDEDVIFGAQYERYDPTLPKYLRDELTDILWNGCNRKLGSLHYQLKAQFQRPRPYQVAFLRGRDFHHVWAKTGGTPSLVSGHCLQGALGGCSAYQHFGSSLDRVSVEVLKQFSVDIGDRRVFAGVHYPSDNLSSWYTAFKLLPHVVDGAVLPSVRAFLWDGINRKSEVFAAITAHIAHHANSPYKVAVKALLDLGSK